MKFLHSLPTALICNLFFFGAHAQGHPQFGLQLGLNTGTVKYETELNHYGAFSTGYQTGVAAGLTSNLPISNHWSVAIGLRYLRTGFTAKDIVPSTDPKNTTSTEYQSSYTLNRVEIPLDILYFFNQNQKGLFLIGGVNVGVLLGGKRKVDIITNDGNKSNVYYAIEDDIMVAKTYPLGTTAYYLQRWDTGIKAGLGYKYKSIAAQAFYRFGVSNIATNSALGFPSPSIYSRLAEIQVAYFFNK